MTIASFVIIFLVMMAAVLIYVGPHAGWRVHNVRSRSMVPTLDTGYLVISTPVKPEDVRTGDIIIFRTASPENPLMVHRVIRIVQNIPLTFIVKGDALPQADPPVPAGDVEGRLVFSMPVLGYPIAFLQTLLGLILSLVAPGLVVAYLTFDEARIELRRRRKTGRP